ncbi:VOC family protein [Aurantimonas aggregata]|uniref:VOC family protein n=1 Tax=Aurantimonas aggregata TaxID=2047720 RepID=A0A6L9MN01_9HYPH|nr:VOC family protein [Aurantimonas aggregata]NDV88966.1 VOC family protein [Aurantimonas aggregata]
MLSHKTSSAILAVSDIDRARAFYGATLGLSAVEDGGDVVVYRTGPTHLVVYRSEEAGTNRANAVVFDAASDIEAIVADMAQKGVAFERYEMDGTIYRDGIHHADGMKMVWFKDPDGNILHINDMPGANAEAESG